MLKKQFSTIFSFIDGGNRRTRKKPPTCSNLSDKFYHIMLYTSSWSRFELTTAVVKGLIEYDHGHDDPLCVFENRINEIAENRIVLYKILFEISN